MLFFPPPVWCTNGGAYQHAIMLAPSSALVAYNGGTNVSHGLVRTLLLSLILFLLPAR